MNRIKPVMLSHSVPKFLVYQRLLLAIAVLALLNGCSGGSGASNESNVQGNPDDAGGGGIVYSGPSPQTDDVQAFKLNVWDNLAEENRCGACHGTGGQAPTFVRADDINEAYNTANGLVDLAIPAESRLVTKVAGGHNCWLTNDGVCGDIIAGYIEDWASVSSSASNVVILTAPEIKEVGQSKSFPDDSADFATTVYPLLAQPSGYCYQCHREDAGTPQQPYFASNDVATAYEAAKSKMDLDNPANSRLVLRLRDEFHNCWSDCSSNADSMQTAIAAFTDDIPLTEVDENLVASKALGLPDGVVASSGGRVETNLIALYEFKAGSGTTAFDTSGVSPAIDLTLSGDVEWVGSWGIRINDGKAQGSTSNSQKLYDLITATGEYSLEAWVVPDNVTQDDSARIVSYSGGTEVRNFTLGQTLYNYDFLNRSSAADGNGQPGLSTPDADEVLQATLQHVVTTYDPVTGSQLYVNGELVADSAGDSAGTLADWDDSFALVVGNEVSSDRLWQGTVRLLAVHNRALAAEDIATNFEAGVGEKFFLLFSVEHLIAVPESYIVFQVQQFDNYSYLFEQPRFLSLDTDAQLGTIAVEGLRIGINGQEAALGQTYANLNISINDSDYIAGEGQFLSTLGAVVELEKGANDDEFFLSFDRLGDNTYVRVDAAPPAPAIPEDVEPQSELGLRTFEEINATLSAMTRVPVTNSGVSATYNQVKQQLPTLSAIDTFLASHQMAVTQLSVKYCSELVDDNSLRDSYFGVFAFDSVPTTAFDAAGRDQIISALQRNLLNNELPASGPEYPVNVEVATQLDPAELVGELNNLIDRVGTCGTCTADTPTVVKAVCAAAVGNAVTLLQ